MGKKMNQNPNKKFNNNNNKMGRSSNANFQSSSQTGSTQQSQSFKNGTGMNTQNSQVKFQLKILNNIHSLTK